MFIKRALVAVAAATSVVAVAHDAGAVDRPVPAVARYRTSQVDTTTITATAAMELGAQATGIGPGSHLFITTAAQPDVVQGCTANFIWDAAETDALYLGAAGHCFIPPTRNATHGIDGDFDAASVHVEVCVAECTNGGQTGFTVTGETVELGPVAYARRNRPMAETDADGVGWDFGIVEIPAELHSLVRRSMPVFGGPVIADADLAAGDITCHYGNALLAGELYPTMGRIGTGIIEGPNGLVGVWLAATPAAPGDSGAAFQTCQVTADGVVGDAAIGILTHITPLGIAGTTMERAVEMGREAGLSLTPLLAR